MSRRADPVYAHGSMDIPCPRGVSFEQGIGVSYHAADMLGAVTAGRYTGRYDILCALVSARMRNATRMGIRAEDPSSFSPDTTPDLPYS